MSHQAAREFIDKASTDASWREKNLPTIEAPLEEKVAAALRVGPQFGYQFTAQEFKEVESVKTFWRQVAGDEKLQEKLKGASQTTDAQGALAGVVKVASEAGFTLSPAVLEEVTRGGLAKYGNTGDASEELSEADLQQVAGGAAAISIKGVPLLLKTFAKDPRALAKRVQSTIMCPW